MFVSVDQTRQRLTDYISAAKRSQSAVAKELGISGAALSQFLNGSYIGSNEDIAEKAEQFFDLDRKRKLCTPSPKFTKELIEAKLVDSLADWNAYRNRLLKSTERIRSALDNSSVKLINIDVQKYIEYWKVFKQDSSEDILLKNLYTLGYLAGKQAEQNCN